MQTAQHTPGPWAVDAAPNGHQFIVAEHRADICRMGSENMLADDSSAAANARLIAAAPELLAVLEHVLDRATMPGFLRDQVRAAIAKAA